MVQSTGMVFPFDSLLKPPMGGSKKDSFPFDCLLKPPMGGVQKKNILRPLGLQPFIQATAAAAAGPTRADPRKNGPTDVKLRISQNGGPLLAGFKGKLEGKCLLF